MSFAKEMPLPARILAFGCLWTVLSGCDALHADGGANHTIFYQDNNQSLTDGTEDIRLYFQQVMPGRADHSSQQSGQRSLAVSGRGEYWVFSPDQFPNHRGEVVTGMLSAVEIEELRRDLRWGEIDARAEARQKLGCRDSAGIISNGTSSYELCLDHQPSAVADQAIVDAIDAWIQRLAAQGSLAQPPLWGYLLAARGEPPEPERAIPLPKALTDGTLSSSKVDLGGVERAMIFHEELSSELLSLQNRLQKGDFGASRNFIPMVDAKGHHYRLYLWPFLSTEAE